MKCCNRCGLEKAESDFTLKDSKTGRRASYCKSCDRMRARTYWYEHHTERLEAHRAYYRANADKVHQRNSKWAREHRRERREYMTTFRDTHRDELRQWARDYIQSPKQKAYRARVRIDQQEQLRVYIKEWRANNPERKKAYEHARRARIQGNGGSYTTAEWQGLKALHNFKCLGCGRQEPEIKLTVDHVTPISRGGDNSISNIQPLCFSCNAHKHTTIADYRPSEA